LKKRKIRRKKFEEKNFEQTWEKNYTEIFRNDQRSKVFLKIINRKVLRERFW
jgi:hypothetical protein